MPRADQSHPRKPVRKCQNLIEGQSHRVPYFELSGHVAVAGGDTQEVTIILGESFRSSNGVVGFGRCVQQVENVLWEGFGNSIRACVRDFNDQLGTKRRTGRS